MNVIGEKFFVDKQIERGLESGAFNRFGGVVRWAEGTEKGGRIVAVLRTVDETARKSSGLQLSRGNVLACMAAVGVTVAIVGFVGQRVVHAVTHLSSKKKKQLTACADAWRRAKGPIETQAAYDEMREMLATCPEKKRKLTLTVAEVESILAMQPIAQDALRERDVLRYRA